LTYLDSRALHLLDNLAGPEVKVAPDDIQEFLL